MAHEGTDEEKAGEPPAGEFGVDDLADLLPEGERTAYRWNQVANRSPNTLDYRAPGAREREADGCGGSGVQAIVGTIIGVVMVPLGPIGLIMVLVCGIGCATSRQTRVVGLAMLITFGIGWLILLKECGPPWR